MYEEESMTRGKLEVVDPGGMTTRCLFLLLFIRQQRSTTATTTMATTTTTVAHTTAVMMTLVLPVGGSGVWVGGGLEDRVNKWLWFFAA